MSLAIRSVGRGGDYEEGLFDRADDVAHEIEVFPGRDGVQPDMAFMHRGDLFEDEAGAEYEILRAKQSRDRSGSGFSEGGFTIRHVYLARQVDGK